MKFSEQNIGGALLLIMEEVRLEASNAPALRKLLVDRIENGSHQIVIDLQRVSFMDSSALGALIGAIKKLGPLGTLALAGANGPVLQLFKLTRMDKVFSLYPTTADALTRLEE